MVKEAVICVIIVTFIFGLEIFTQNFTKETVSQMTGTLTSLKDAISNEDNEKIKEEIDTLYKNWESKHGKLAYYIEHDELEKVETAIVRMKSYIESEKFEDAIAELEDGKFVLEHIQDKNSFNLENIF